MALVKRFRIDLSQGAAVLAVILFVFTVAVAKIDRNSIDAIQATNHSICQVTRDSNKNVDSQRARVNASIDRYDQQAVAEDHIADVWQGLTDRATGSSKLLGLKLVNSHRAIAELDRESARDLRAQLPVIQPFHLNGC